VSRNVEVNPEELARALKRALGTGGSSHSGGCVEVRAVAALYPLSLPLKPHV
jgi:hypothetical protein